MPVRVGMGFGELPFSGAAPFWDWIDMLEDGGVNSYWQSDRIASARPHLEPMAALGAVAGRTRRLKFGMNVASLALREPVLLAKQCATIDYLSAGRLLPAFGIGAKLAPDWAATGMPTAGRGARADEALEIIIRLWKGETLDYDGKYFQLKGARISPTPVNPNIPMWIGGATKAAVERTAKYGTGWQAAFESPAQLAPVVRAIRETAVAQGRPVADDHFGAAFPFRFGSMDEEVVATEAGRFEKRLRKDPTGYFVVGDEATILDRIRAYVDAGASKFILRPIAGSDADLMDQTRKFIDLVQPELDAIPLPKAA
ncbi:MULTISPECIES: LLM class flavin-dependent oxidoreductase [unclassified Minwuia]|jgi:probable F420-dependent oxidoreductase|uniref:LLM class flavin-dependent oxidoreductase n=1 Tax=unclassified Minwuia TaxID=2618799 RepID=UPI0024786EDC|nr:MULTISPECIES: LLM class flavin-dependent oxidoreductase [unclassified Minwuia]